MFWKPIQDEWMAMPTVLMAGNTATVTIEDDGPYDADLDPRAMLVGAAGPHRPGRWTRLVEGSAAGWRRMTPRAASRMSGDKARQVEVTSGDDSAVGRGYHG